MNLPKAHIIYKAALAAGGPTDRAEALKILKGAFQLYSILEAPAAYERACEVSLVFAWASLLRDGEFNPIPDFLPPELFFRHLNQDDCEVIDALIGRGRGFSEIIRTFQPKKHRARPSPINLIAATKLMRGINECVDQ